MERRTIECVGLINSNGIEFPAKCIFFFEKQTEYYYYRGKQKTYIGYPVAEYKRKQKLHSEEGQWHIKRQAFETITASGKTDWWYDNDKSMIRKVSKFGRKLFTQLNKN